MKRILSILMLLLMLLVGVQPTVSMHFCGKNLQSVDIMNKQMDNACCKMSHPKSETEHKQVSIHSESCCSSQEIQISTDDYQYQQQTLHYSTPQSVDLAWAIYAFQASNLKPLFSTKLRKDFPPDGFTYLNRDILTSISILRI